MSANCYSLLTNLILHFLKSPSVLLIAASQVHLQSEHPIMLALDEIPLPQNVKCDLNLVALLEVTNRSQKSLEGLVQQYTTT